MGNIVSDFYESNDDLYTPLFRNKENIKFVLNAMFKSTNEVMGTSYRSRIDDPKYQFAGKTGTAQVKKITKEERELDLELEQIPYFERDHAWYIAFGPYKDPRYALSILVEHGGSGSISAAPMAKKLFKLLIDRHELREKINLKYSTNSLMYQNYSLSEKSTFFQKLRSIDYILLVSTVLIVGVISIFAMYSTDGGEILYPITSKFCI